ncbi:MAG: transporter substrate-binding domain-containing protein [Deltaproteobacteria bacterium]|nr:transporter substrate-binding domain-containing protein [Deltaproteobacteria bacterium]
MAKNKRRNHKLRMFHVFLTTVLFLMLSHIAEGREKLKIYVENDAAPWSKTDGTGYANDLVKAIYDAVDVDVDFEVVPYARCKKHTETGEAVGCFNMAKIPDVENIITFPESPLFFAYISYFHNIENPLSASKAEDVKKGTIVGTVIGYEYDDMFYKLEKEGQITVEETRSEEMNIKKLGTGRLDAVILWNNETKPADFIIEKAGMAGKVALAFHSTKLELHMGFSKAHPKGELALQKYNEGIKRIQSNGVYDQITQDWVKRAYSTE